MKLLFAMFALTAGFLSSQPTQKTQAVPDCQINFTLSSGQSSTSWDNRSTACTSWTVVYVGNSTGTVSLLFQDAPDNAGSPGTFVAFAGTLVTGTNPLVSTAQGMATFTGYYAWLNVKLTATGGGTVKGSFYGWKQQGAKIGGGGGGGSIALTTDPLKGDGAGNAVAESSADVVGLFNGGTCAGYLKNDGTCSTPPGFANPMTTLGDTIYGAAAGTPTPLPGNTTTVQKFLSQTGDGANSAAPSWQVMPAAGTLTYYFTPIASDIATYLQQTTTPYSPKTTLTFAALATGTDTIQNFATNAGFPGLTFIPAGSFEFHIHALRTGGGTVNLQAQFWEVSALGVDIGQIGTTTEASVALGNSEVEYRLYMVTANTYTMGTPASRVVCRVQAVVSGSSPTVQLFVGGTADSHISLPSNTVDATNFVPYSGATADVNIGTHSFIGLGAVLPVTDTGTGNAYAGCPTGSPTLGDGTVVIMTTAHPNTGASTLAYCSGTARAIVLQDASTALSGGEITSVVLAKYQATGTKWVLLDPVSAGGSVDAVLGKSSLTAPDIGKIPVITAAGTIGPSSVAVVDLDFPLALMALVNVSYTGGTTFTLSGHPELTILPAGTFVGLGGLTYLNLYSNALTTPPVLTTNTALTALNLYSNALTTPPVLTTNTALTALYLNTNALTTPPVLTTNTALTTLDLSSNALTTPPVLTTNTALTALDLGSNALTTPPVLTTNTALTTLGLYSNALTTPPVLTTNTALTALDLGSNALTTPPVLTTNTALTTLNLYTNALTTPPVLTTNTMLNYLDLTGNALDATGINSFLADLVVCCTSNAGTLDISGGTNAAPTGQGILDAQTLTTAGWSVSTNTVTLAITGVNQGTQTFTVAGDQTAYFPATSTFTISGSTGGLNDGTYTVVSATFGTSTDVVVVEVIPSPIVDGNITAL